MVARLALVAVALVVLPWAAAFGQTAQGPGEEIPLEQCDRLPVVTIRIADANMRFLVDTAATSVLNLESFEKKGRSTSIRITSWSGTAPTSAREVSLPDLTLGSHHLRDLKLPAVDLSPIGKACGGPIDGILGVDLLERTGATIDLRRRIASLSTATEDSNRPAWVAEIQASTRTCTEAFNLAQVEELAACFDPEFVLYLPWGEIHGREQAIAYLRQRYLSLTPRPKLEIRTRELHWVGGLVWHSFDFGAELANIRLVGHGIAMCRKSEGRWRMLYMHNSLVQPEPTLSH